MLNSLCKAYLSIKTIDSAGDIDYHLSMGGQMNKEAIFEYLDDGERRSIHFVLSESGMMILHKILLEHGRYVNKGGKTIFFVENAEAKEIAGKLKIKIERNADFKLDLQIVELMKDRESWFIEEKKLEKAGRQL